MKFYGLGSGSGGGSSGSGGMPALPVGGSPSSRNNMASGSVDASDILF